MFLSRRKRTQEDSLEPNREGLGRVVEGKKGPFLSSGIKRKGPASYNLVTCGAKGPRGAWREGGKDYGIERGGNVEDFPLDLRARRKRDRNQKRERRARLVTPRLPQTLSVRRSCERRRKTLLDWEDRGRR